MAKAPDQPPGRMTVDEFVDWATAQPEGRFELVDVVVVAMAPERAAHARLKARVWRAFDDQIRDCSLPCEALPDGMTVKVDDHTAYEPDAQVHCGERLADDVVIVPAPVIVVEVLSPSTAMRDTGAKLADYFRVASVQHYLIVRTDRPTVIHHRRGEGEAIETRIITAGSVQLDPAGHCPRARPYLRLMPPGPRLARAAGRRHLGPEEAAPMAKALDRASLYETDYVAWLEEQVTHLRAGRLAALDVENVAVELHGLMNSQRQQLENRLEVLIHHLLKWDHQPDQRSNRWRATVQEQRTRIRRLLRFGPSLRSEVERMALEVFSDAVRAAAIETRLSESTFPPTLPYSNEEIFEREQPAEELPDQRSTRKKT